MARITTLLTLGLFLGACERPGPTDSEPAPASMPTVEPASFAPGDCPTAPDGYVWRVARIEGNEYVAAGWQGKGKGWGNEARFELGHFRALGYTAAPCPRL